MCRSLVSQSMDFVCVVIITIRGCLFPSRLYPAHQCFPPCAVQTVPQFGGSDATVAHGSLVATSNAGLGTTESTKHGETSYARHQDHGGTNPTIEMIKCTTISSSSSKARSTGANETQHKNNDNTREGTCLALRPWRDKLTIATFKHITLSTDLTTWSTTNQPHHTRTMTQPKTTPRHDGNSE